MLLPRTGEFGRNPWLLQENGGYGRSDQLVDRSTEPTYLNDQALGIMFTVKNCRFPFQKMFNDQQRQTPDTLQLNKTCLSPVLECLKASNFSRFPWLGPKIRPGLLVKLNRRLGNSISAKATKLSIKSSSFWEFSC